MDMKHAAALSAIVVAFVSGCSSGDQRGPAGGPVAGPLDTHCGTRVQVTRQASCQTSGSPVPIDPGSTMLNAEGDDDGCKYHLKFTASPVYENTDVTVTVTATTKADGAVATGANVDAEVYLDSTHPAPNSGQRTTETSPGTYRIGPVRFDKAGRWTFRFHLFEQCLDSVPDSPHGHAAFFIDVF